MEKLLDGLNVAQREAVTNSASVLQVLAPPGSGKTKTLTARVAYLVGHHGFKPWDIVVCTFTIKAAREMKERICGTLTEKQAVSLILGTFHSVARRYLVQYGQHIGIKKNFGIADSSDTLGIIRRIVKTRSYGIDPGAARSRISSHKAKDISSEQAAAKSKGPDQQEFSALFAEYEEHLRVQNLLDYDDLLLRCRDLLLRCPNCVSNIEAVLIDEFQDTNNVQYDLMCLFAQHRRRITIVGDPDQSIYGFRSAEIKNLSRMTTRYPDTVVIHLEENYRSAGSILACALRLIEQDKARPAKNLLATHCRGEQPVFRKLPSAQAEAKWIASEIQRCHALTGKLIDHSDVAILLRSAALSLPIEKELAAAKVPYRMLAGKKFFDRHEIKVILDYLRVVNQPEHNDALVRVINVPSRKVGEVTYKALLAEAEEKKVTLWSLILDAAQGRNKPKTKISNQAQLGIESFVDVILSARSKLETLESKETTLFDLVMYLVKKLSLHAYLEKHFPDDHADRWQNVEELIAQATDMTQVGAGEHSEDDEEALPKIIGVEQRSTNTIADTLARYLTDVALATEADKSGDENTPQVTISTIHSAKGLEWPVVFIPGVYEGSIPHSRSEDHDEERRLLYVGMTRAQALLYLSYPFKNSRDHTTISHFMTSTEGMAAKGAVFDFSVTRDLAKILRRECPPDDVLLKGRTLVERPEDDLWPTEITDSDDLYWDALARGDPDALTSRRQPRGHFTSIEITGVSVSMQQSAGFSVVSTTVPSGFVSAAQLKRIEEPRLSRNACTPDTTSHKPPPLKKQKSGQASIASFFAKPKTGIQRAENVPARPFTTPNALPLSHNITNTVGFVPVSRSGLTDEPFPARKPISKPLLNKPRRPVAAQEESRKRYVLLSSSPTKPDNDEYAKGMAAEEPASPTKSSTFSGGSGSSTAVNSDFRPVSTLHSTSMSTIGNNAPTRKTLGVKRTFNGWSDRMSREK